MECWTLCLDFMIKKMCQLHLQKKNPTSLQVAQPEETPQERVNALDIFMKNSFEELSTLILLVLLVPQMNLSHDHSELVIVNLIPTIFVNIIVHVVKQLQYTHRF